MLNLKSIFVTCTFVLSAYIFAAEQRYVPGELIVKLKENVSMNSLMSAGMDILEAKKIDIASDDLFLLKTGDTKKLEKELSGNPNIEYAEPNYIYSLITPIIDRGSSPKDSSDQRFGELWGLQNTGNNGLFTDPINPAANVSQGIAGADINALRAWEITKGSKAIKIAVLDTGIDYGHPDLRENMWVNQEEVNGKPGIDDDGNGYIDDIHGYDFFSDDGDPMDEHNHGTHCAGTIAAVHNDVGISGVVADASLVAVRILGPRGSSKTEEGNPEAGAESIARAIDYATKINVDIMSNSWGGGAYSQTVFNAIKRARDKGIVFVAAAGNSFADNDKVGHYPSDYELDNVISVAAHSAQNDLAYFSSFGKESVHIAAPGHRILSTVIRGRGEGMSNSNGEFIPGSGYDTYSGTSMATPHVSGALGLLLSQEGRMEHLALRERLMNTGVPNSFYQKTISGRRLDAYNLLSDFRPAVQIKPQAGKWVRVKVSNPWETKHPYAGSQKISRTFKIPGAKFIRLVLDRYDMHRWFLGHDSLYIKNSEGRLMDYLSGKGENYVSSYTEGDSLTVAIRTDRFGDGWGFSVQEVEVQY